MKQFLDIFPDTPDIHIVDVGAADLEGKPIYQPILDRGGYFLTGFEPNPAMFELLHDSSRVKYYPHALGDGKQHALNLFSYPGMNSFLEPDHNVLDKVLMGDQFGVVIGQLPMDTVRLDDLTMPDIDFLKIDIQGSELMVLQNAIETLKRTLVIHIEVQFVQFYKEQPLFGDLDCFLRSQGFMFHKFEEIHQTQSQMYWSDAVYVKDFTKLYELTFDQNMKLARILHDIYGSFDIAELAMKCAEPVFYQKYKDELAKGGGKHDSYKNNWV
jgi:FkbM family methyltransferase